MSEDDKILLAYVAGIVTAAVVVPSILVLMVRYLPPVQRAVRQKVEREVDGAVARIRRNATGEVALINAAVTGVLPVTTGRTVEQIVHEQVSVRAADAVLDAFGAPPDAGRV